MLTIELAGRLLKKFEIDGLLAAKPEPLGGGRQHQCYLLTLFNGYSYVLKKLSPQTYQGPFDKEQFCNAEAFARRLILSEAQSLTALLINGSPLINVEGVFYAMFKFINAKSLTMLSLKQCSQLGNMLAEIHAMPSIAQPILNTKVITQPWQLNHWQRLLSEGVISKQSLVNLAELAETVYQVKKVTDGFYYYSHRDLNLSNILWLKHDLPIIIDWESAGFINPYVELIGCAFNWAGLTQASFCFSAFLAVIDAYFEAAKGCLRIPFNPMDYTRAYYSWFKWLDFCLQPEQRLTKSELDKKEIALTLEAIALMQQYQKQIIHYITCKQTLITYI